MEIDPITQFLPLPLEEQDWLDEETGSVIKDCQSAGGQNQLTGPSGQGCKSQVSLLDT